MTRDEYLRGHAERRAAILAHFQQSQSAAETGRAFGISRQRVLQIVNKTEAKDGQDHARGGNASPAAGTVLGG